MKNKKRLLFIIPGLVVIFVLLRFWSHFNLLKEMYENGYDRYFKLAFKNYEGSNNSLKFMDGFWIKDDKFDKQFKIDYRYYDHSQIYDKKMDQQVLKIVESVLPENYEEYTTKLAPSFLKLIKQKQSQYIFDEKSLDELSKPVSYNYLRNTLINILYISLKLENDKDLRNALILSHGLLHLGEIIRTKNIYVGDNMCSVFADMCSRYACPGILHWASTPKPGYEQFTLEIAQNILDLIKYRPSYSQLIDVNWCKYSRLFDCIADNNWFIWASSDSSLSREFKEFLYEEPKKFLDKPYYEIKTQLEKYESEFYKKLESEQYRNKVTFFLKPSSYLTNEYWLVSGISPTYRLKKSAESSLALMEVSAIALVFNAYVSKTGEMPESMAELEEWFGQKLPVNRFTGKPYVLYSEEGCVLYNLGNDEKKDTEWDRPKNDMFFKFSE